MSRTFLRFKFVCLLAGGLFSLGAAAQAPAANGRWDYRLMATNKTSTTQKEMNEAADAGFRFQGVMGGQTAFGGQEAVVIFGKRKDSAEEPHCNLHRRRKAESAKKNSYASHHGNFQRSLRRNELRFASHPFGSSPLRLPRFLCT
jgi:hypothetical protein